MAVHGIKPLSVLFLLSVLVSCNQQDSKQVTTITDSAGMVSPVSDSGRVIGAKGPVDQKDSVRLTARDSVLLRIAENILVVIKARDFKKLSSFVHPVLGVRFSPYAYVNTADSTVLSARQLANPATLSEIVNWAAFAADDTSRIMSIRRYFDRFVYDKDFLHAENKSVNRFSSGGTDLNNIREAFPGADVVEFHFPGFDPLYEGMDFRTLRLVLKTEDTKTYLTGIVHAEWTP